MIMNPGMLLFGLVDSGVAFFLVYYMIKARFGGTNNSWNPCLRSIFCRYCVV